MPEKSDEFPLQFDVLVANYVKALLHCFTVLADLQFDLILKFLSSDESV